MKTSNLYLEPQISIIVITKKIKKLKGVISVKPYFVTYEEIKKNNFSINKTGLKLEHENDFTFQMLDNIKGIYDIN